MTIRFRPLRRASLPAVLAAMLLAAAACNYQRIPRQPTIEEAPRLASTVHMGDATAAAQLVSGFYDIEGGSWRWTQKQFAVKLRPPAQAARQGAVLDVHLTVPEPSIEALKSLTLTASVGGSTLAPETYRKAGEFIYRRDVDPRLISGDAVRIDFQLDKTIAPGASDLRELGIVVTSAGLLAK
ncbi:MAG: hypothetical protein ABSH40_17445 [Bryobacteraceae bacterium]|jgi:hypothetical protein